MATGLMPADFFEVASSRLLPEEKPVGVQGADGHALFMKWHCA